MGKSFRQSVATIVAALAITSAGSAAATPTLWYFGGAFTEANGTSAPAVGSQFFGALAYDPAAARINTGANWADYALPPGALTLDANGGQATSATNGMLVATGHGVFIGGRIDQHRQADSLKFGGLFANNTGTLAGFDEVELFQYLASESTALDSLNLPASPFALSTHDLLETALIAYDYEDPLHFLRGTITCLATDETACRNGGGRLPEPGSLMLMLGSLGLLAGARRRMGRLAIADSVAERSVVKAPRR